MDISHLLNQTILVENPSGGRDKNGQAAMGSSVSMASRFERRYSTIVTPEREREPVHGRVFTTSPIRIGAKVTYDGEVYRALEISQRVVGGGSLHHYTTLLQRWSFNT